MNGDRRSTENMKRFTESVYTKFLEFFQRFLDQRHPLLVRLGGRRFFVCVLELFVQRQRTESRYVQIIVLLQDQLNVLNFDIFGASVLGYKACIGNWNRKSTRLAIDSIDRVLDGSLDSFRALESKKYSPRLSIKSSAMVNSISSTSSSSCSLLSISATSSCSRCLFSTTTKLLSLSFSDELASPFVCAVLFAVVLFEAAVDVV